MMLTHELERKCHVPLRVRELERAPGALDVLDFASRGQDVAFLVVGRVNLLRRLEPDVVRGIEPVCGGCVRRNKREDGCKACCASSHTDLLSLGSLSNVFSQLLSPPPG